MPILNYTTTIEAEKSIMEIEKILVNHGAKSVMKDYNNGLPIALSFLLKTPTGDLPVRLPADPEAVLKVMQRSNVRSGLCNRAQAFRVAWRIIKDWIEAQMAVLETEQVRMDQIFLPYIETHNGKTIYQLYQEKQNLLLNPGKETSGGI